MNTNIRDIIESIISKARVSARMTEREEEVIRKRYGLNDGTPATLEEIGHDYGVTRFRILQNQTSAIRKMRMVTNQSDLIQFKSLFEDLDFLYLARDLCSNLLTKEE